ncbi:PREDICTED: agamous-like MADS-box protein AGL61 [Tarenaya hassleriana]|uniref:agamous-like MADS-box protein AGL61 n=1 Tax=Tarenaya hassleriana TaxID=28532 RepID=UPI00053C4E1F|nr:PREDICTED: agamous-like MADS-box protein AGL61 [Tarenaya hassleriana]
MEQGGEASTFTCMFPMEQQQLLNPNLLLKKNPEKTKNPKTRGRQRIEIKEIKEEAKRQVTFSKRRRGLFKKAAELSVLCDTKIAIITFSRCGRIYTFGDVETLTERYLHGEKKIVPARLGEYSGGGDAYVEAEEQRWWEMPVENVAAEEMEEYLAAMTELRENVRGRIYQMSCDRAVENPSEQNPTVEIIESKQTVDDLSLEYLTAEDNRGDGLFLQQFLAENMMYTAN